MNLREEETKRRRERFVESLKNDPEMMKELIIGLQNAAPAAWEKLDE